MMARAEALPGRSQAGRAVVMTAVLTWLALILVAPVVALVEGLLDAGPAAAWEALAAPAARQALWMSLRLTAIAVLVNAVVGVAGAIVLTRQAFRARAALDALVDLPLAVSPVMVGLAFMVLFGRTGWFAPLLAKTGLRVLYAFPGLLLATLFVTLPFTVREVARVMADAGVEEEAAAATLGASGWQILWRVTLPKVRHGLSAGLLMTAARSLGEFGAVLVLGGNISGRTATATTFVHDAVEARDAAGAYGMAAALATISVALLLALEWSRRRAKSGA
jgi:sulfate transport system permease protein